MELQTEKKHWFILYESERKQIVYELEILLEGKKGFEMLEEMLKTLKKKEG